ncbi:hypothetical protein BRC69_01820, partial [Halobacteriales archaeon QH_6_66_25]
EKRGGDPYRYDSGGDTVSIDSDPKVWDTDNDLLSDGEEFETRTDPRERVTFGITEDHQDDIVDGLYEAWDGGDAQERANIRITARAIGIISENQDVSDLRRDRLTDARDSFDFVYPGDGSDVIDDLTFKSLDYVPEYNEVERSDIWLSTLEELGVHDTDPWDPDTDDDGLTDGQELYGITKLSLTTPSRVGDLRRVTDDGDFDFEGLDPSDPDSDGDSYWDGWIGVWNVEDSKNLILYMENLQNGGVSGDEAVPEQAGVHEVVRGDPPSQTSADIDGDGDPEHSNVRADEPDTSLEIEVDYVEGRDPESITTSSGDSVLEAAEKNFRMYDLDIRFDVDDEIPEAELRDICKARQSQPGPCQTIDPDELNRYELGIIEDEYHDDSDKLHLFWGTELGNDRPKTLVDERLDYDSLTPTGIALNNGAPNTEKVTLIENEFGIMVAADRFESSDTEGLQSVTMHETGHALGVGWADDTAISIPLVGDGLIPKGFEVYSGDVDGDAFEPDETPERAVGPSPEWSIMRSGTADNLAATASPQPRLAYSIEELSTIDFEDVPSR